MYVQVTDANTKLKIYINSDQIRFISEVFKDSPGIGASIHFDVPLDGIGYFIHIKESPEQLLNAIYYGYTGSKGYVDINEVGE